MDRSHVVFVIISKDHKAKKLHKPIIPRERELYNIYPTCIQRSYVEAGQILIKH